MKRLLFAIYFLCNCFSSSLHAQLAGEYLFSYANNTTYVPITGTVITSTTYMGIEPAIPIGFIFNYCGYNYNMFNATEFGAVYFGTTCMHGNFENTEERNILGALWASLETGPNTLVTYNTSGTAPNRILTVQWYAINWSVFGNPQNFQIKLYESSNVISFVYGSMANPQGTTIGVVGILGNVGGPGDFLCVTPTTIPTVSSTINHFISNPTNFANRTFTFTPNPCIAPTGLVTSGVAETEVEFSLTSLGNLFNVKYGVIGYNPGNMINGVSFPYTLSNLTEATKYSISVQKDCEGGSLSSWTNIDFWTKCYAKTAPYFQNFDVSGYNFPPCWKSYVQSTTGTAAVNIIPASNMDPYSPPYCAMLSSPSNTDINAKIILIAPEFSDLQNHNTFIRFKAMSDFVGPVLYVGTMSDPTNPSTFTTFQTISTLNQSWQEFVIPFSSYTGSDNFIAFRLFSSGGQVMRTIYIDDFSYEIIPTCSYPLNLSASSILDSSATLNWNAGDNDTLWDIQYGSTGFAIGTGTFINNLSSTSYNLTGLIPNSNYQFYVHSKCSITDSSGWNGPCSFTTSCGVVNVPYSEDFGTAVPPKFRNCTFTQKIGTSNLWKVVNGVGGGYTGIALVYEGAYSDPANVWFYNRCLNLTGGVSYRLTFDYSRQNPSALQKLRVCYGLNHDYLSMNDTIIDLPGIINSNIMTATADFTPANSGYYYIGFNCYSSFYPWSNALVVDNIYVEQTPTCIRPTSLDVISVTPNSALLSWTPGSNETSWDIQYGLYGFTLGSGTINSNINSNTFSLNGLEPGTRYTYYVSAKCNPGDSSNWSWPFSFTTSCSLVTDFIQNFDQVIAPNFPSCWGKVGSTGSVTIRDTSSFSPPNCVCIASLPTSKGVLKIIQLSNTSDNTHWLRFKAKTIIFPGSVIEVGYVEVINYAEIFVPLRSVTITSLNYQEYYVDLGTDPGTNTTLAFRHSGVPDYPVFIDDVVWETKPTCLAPDSLVLNNVNSNSAIVSWSVSGNDTLWNIQYGLSGFTIGTGNFIYNVSSNPDTLSNLLSGTSYQFYVQAKCSSSDSSMWAGPMTFSTICNPVTDFNQNFDNITNMQLPNCWSKVGAEGDVKIVTTNAYSSPNCVFLYSPSNSEMGTLALEPVSNAGNNTHWIKFFARGYNNVGSILEVGYLTNPADATSFVQVQTVVISTLNYQEYIINLGTNPGSNTVIAIRNSGNPAYPVLVDNIVWVAHPTCLDPINLSVTNVSYSSADLNWTALSGESLWNVQYGLSNFTLGTGTTIYNISSNPFTLNGLIPNTNYKYYIQAKCSLNDSSIWAGPFYFSTTYVPFAPPFNQIFNIFPPYYWSRAKGFCTQQVYFSNTNTSNWTYDGLGNIGTTGAVRIRIYGIGCRDWLISPVIDLGNGSNYQLTFDIALTTTGNTNYPNLTGTDDKFAVVISTDGGNAWSSDNTLCLWDNSKSVYSFNSLSPTVTHVSIPLSGYTGLIKVGFYGESTIVNADNDLSIDNVRIFLPVDLAVLPSSIDTLNECNLTSNENLSTFIKNVGSVPIYSGNNIFSWYKVDLNPSVKDTLLLTADLLPDDSITFYFSQPCDLSTNSVYNVKYWTSNADDINSMNDTINNTIKNSVLSVEILGGDTIYIDPINIPYNITIQPTSQVYDSYFWSNYDGSNNGTSQVFSANYGWNYLTVTGSGCLAYDSIFIANSTAKPIVRIDSNIRVYPNPNNGHFIVEICSATSDNYIFELFKTDGTIITTKFLKEVNKWSILFDETTLTKGVYILKIQQSNNLIHKKIVVY